MQWAVPHCPILLPKFLQFHIPFMSWNKNILPPRAWTYQEKSSHSYINQEWYKFVHMILVDFGFRGLVVTYFDFWWSQRLFSEKAVGKRVVGSGSVTKLAIDQLKPRRSSLSATSVQCKQALHNTLQFTALLHFPHDRPLHFLCMLSLCTALARQNALHFSHYYICNISHLI